MNATMPVESDYSLGDALSYLFGCKSVDEIPAELVRWPPDVFAAAALLLRESGGYLEIVCSGPPDGLDADAWHQTVEEAAAEWTRLYEKAQISSVVQAKWDALLARRDVKVEQVRNDCGLVHLLLWLLAVADEAAGGFGVPILPHERKKYSDCVTIIEEANLLLFQQAAWAEDHPGTRSTLCRHIDSAKFCVLPKMHTPQSGITIRSLSLHLALIQGCDVSCSWNNLSSGSLADEDAGEDPDEAYKHGINLLLVPHPSEVFPSLFHRKSPRFDSTRYLPQEHGFFEFAVEKVEENFESNIATLCKKAAEQVGHVHGIVLPEAALLPADFYNLEHKVGPYVDFVVGGVIERFPIRPRRAITRRGSAGASGMGTNPGKVKPLVLRQHKHHRWFLDAGQIARYGLGASLDPDKKWWEHTSLQRREVRFMTLSPYLTFTVLICEDLARPDPTCDIVRSVGPNLVITLLQDGPQLETRWASRYATVLADDPGSSVLTLTSLGMSLLSRPENSASGSRVVALWKDPFSGSRQLSLSPGKDAILLSLTNSTRTEFTADGRNDGGQAGCLRLLAYTSCRGVLETRHERGIEPANPVRNL